MIVGNQSTTFPRMSSLVNVSGLPSTRRLRVASAGGIGAGVGHRVRLHRLRVGSMRSLGYTVCPQRHVRVVNLERSTGDTVQMGAAVGAWADSMAVRAHRPTTAMKTSFLIV